MKSHMYLTKDTWINPIWPGNAYFNESNQSSHLICQIGSIFCEFMQSRANRSELNKSRQTLDGHQRVRLFCISLSRELLSPGISSLKKTTENPDLVIEKQLHLNGVSPQFLTESHEVLAKHHCFPWKLQCSGCLDLNSRVCSPNTKYLHWLAGKPFKITESPNVAIQISPETNKQGLKAIGFPWWFALNQDKAPK